MTEQENEKRLAFKMKVEQQVLQYGRPIIDMDYLNGRPLSYSSLKEFRKSPRHFIHYITKPWEPPTDAYKIGLLAEYFLTNSELGESFYNMPKIDRRTKVGKEEFLKHTQAAMGKIMVDQYQIDKGRRMADIALADPLINEMIENRREEQKKLLWKEKIEYNGKVYRIPMIGFVDFETVISAGHFIIDLKTDRNGNPMDFPRSVTKFQYHLQAGLYANAYMKSAFKFPGFRWIVMDSVEPYGAFVMEMSNRDIDRAKAEIKGLLVKFVQCMEDNRWDEDYRFWLRDDATAFSFFLPKWATSPVMLFDDEDEENE